MVSKSNIPVDAMTKEIAATFKGYLKDDRDFSMYAIHKKIILDIDKTGICSIALKYLRRQLVIERRSKKSWIEFLEDAYGV